MFGPTRKSEKRDAETAATLIEISESLADGHLRLRFLILFAFLNAAIWISAIVFAKWLYYLFTEVSSLTDTPGIAAMSLPLGSGFYAAYSFLRSRFPDIEDNKLLESEMMSTYQYQSDSTKRWFVWVASAAIGVLNTSFLVVLVSYVGAE